MSRVGPSQNREGIQTPGGPPPGADPGWREGFVLGNRFEAWVVSLALAMGLVLVLTRVRRWLAGRAGRVASGAVGRRSQAAALAARFVRSVSVVVVAVVAVHLASLVLVLSATAERFRRYALVAALAFQAALWARELVDFGIDAFARRRAGPNGEPDAGLVTTLGAARLVLLLAAYSVTALVALQNMGVDVTAMIAGLGIGGIAVALAVQNILGDLFGSLSIVMDKPFVVGDFIVVGDLMGTVERIGVKTTRLRALSGEQLILSNSDLLSSRIRNFKRMAERRAVFSVGVTYDTPGPLVERARQIVADAVSARPGVRLDRCHFHRFGPSSLDIEAVYYVASPEYGVYMDHQHAINLRILEEFRSAGIQFAFPTQTIHLAGAGPAAPGVPGATGPSAP